MFPLYIYLFSHDLLTKLWRAIPVNPTQLGSALNSYEDLVCSYSCNQDCITLISYQWLVSVIVNWHFTKLGSTHPPPPNVFLCRIHHFGDGKVCVGLGGKEWFLDEKELVKRKKKGEESSFWHKCLKVKPLSHHGLSNAIIKGCHICIYHMWGWDQKIMVIFISCALMLHEFDVSNLSQRADMSMVNSHLKLNKIRQHELSWSYSPTLSSSIQLEIPLLVARFN